MLDRYKPVAEAITLLLFPYAEVVLHNLGTGRIEAIYNSFSKRAAGDESLLGEMSLSQDLFPPYFKTNWDGRAIKSVTAVLKNESGSSVGFLCINLDVSKYVGMHRFILDIIKPATGKPDFLFKNDWRERINIFVSNYLKQHALHLGSMSREEKITLLSVLQYEGAFNTKNAASYVADVLQVSRATVYNYLKEINENSTV